MAIQAFTFTENIEGEGFARSFLSSPDFTLTMLRDIAKSANIPVVSSRNGMIQNIVSQIHNQYVRKRIIQGLTSRQRRWVTIRKIENPISEFSTGTVDPHALLISPGKMSSWYGAVNIDRDKGAKWYIKPYFTEHWILQEGHQEPVKAAIRWLVFARVKGNYVTFHWNGFGNTEELENVSKQNTQFEYWNVIPDIVDDFQRASSIRLSDIKLHDLILGNMWDMYRDDDKGSYIWTDRRVRAESSGVYLNARSGGIVEIALDEEDNGLSSLSNSIWRALEEHIHRKYTEVNIPSDHDFKKIILGTIIRDLGSISYEFELQMTENDTTESIFRGHCYFGVKPNTKTVDRLVHIRLHLTGLDDLQQLDFLLSHIGVEHVDSGFKQSKLF